MKIKAEEIVPCVAELSHMSAVSMLTWFQFMKGKHLKKTRRIIKKKCMKSKGDYIVPCVAALSLI